MTHNLVLRNCVSISVVSYSNVMKVSSPCVSNTHSHSHFSVYFWVVSYEGSVGSCLRVLRASVSFFPWVFLVLDPRALGGELGVLVRNLRTIMVVYRVNVFESSGAGSPGTEGGISG